MKEKIKSVILLLLVLNSLILSSLLIFYKPNSINVSLSEYLPRLKFGQDYSYKDLVKPNKIIYHFGENKHTIVNSNSSYYIMLLNDFEEWSFYDIYDVTESIDWTYLIEENKGIELNFSYELSGSIISSLFKDVDYSNQLENINKIWIYEDENANIFAYFISESKDKVYKSNTSLSNKKLNSYLNELINYPNYVYHISYPISDKFVSSFYYLPSEGISTRVIKKSITLASINDFINLLFIDPSIVKRIEMNDQRSILYTDGNRSMQYYPNEKYISYYQPPLDNAEVLNIDGDLYTVVRYVNQHGGWDGEYFIDDINLVNDGAYFKFKQYVDGYPIEDKENYYGIIQLKINNGIVNSFGRSIVLLLDDYLDQEIIYTFSDQEIMTILEEKNIKENYINDIELIYTLERTTDSIVLQPYWKIKLIDNTTIEVPAYESVVH